MEIDSLVINVIKNFIILAFIYLFIIWFEYSFITQVGNSGQQGLPGNKGLIGPTGDKGINGSQNNLRTLPYTTIGQPGLKGPQGSKGNNGNQGSIGYRGSQGPKGLNGTDGPIGLQGPVGPSGLPGLNGIDVDWYFTKIDKSKCVTAIYDVESGRGYCPNNTFLVGVNNSYNNYYEMKCCNMAPDLDLQKTGYDTIKKGLPLNSPLMTIY
jgi:hypothetical protein